MKKFILMSALVLGSLGIKNADAQIGIHINVNLGNRPVYVPAPRPVAVVTQPVYDDYYYLPQVDAYYSVAEKCYYYQDGGRWLSAVYLPGRYHNFDWRTAQRYEIHTNRPYLQHEVYRSRYNGTINRNEYANRNPYNNNRERAYDRRDDNRGPQNDHRQNPAYHNEQPSGRNNNDNHSRGGSFNNDNHLAQNNIGVVNNRPSIARPSRF